ncbi:hypothetical protein NQ317_013995, partial [Molorchus minor]
SKYRRKVYMWKLIIFSMPFFYVSSIVYGKCNSTLCAKTGMCKNDTCVCYDGWQGSYCQFCGGKPPTLPQLSAKDEKRQPPCRLSVKISAEALAKNVADVRRKLQ